MQDAKREATLNITLPTYVGTVCPQEINRKPDRYTYLHTCRYVGTYETKDTGCWMLVITFNV